MLNALHILLLTFLVLVPALTAAQPADSPSAKLQSDTTTIIPVEEIVACSGGAVDSAALLPHNNPVIGMHDSETGKRYTLYDFPYSPTLSIPNWKRTWVNTGFLATAGVSTVLVLESLPASKTSWGYTEGRKQPVFKRWWQNVKKGPAWTDKPVFSYFLHPYAGAVYYMSARSNGFNIMGSFTYSLCVSTFLWNYGFEAFNERPSAQDLILTPVVGSAIGEGFYMVKRHIVDNGYRLLGSKALGYITAFILDPINELTGYFRGEQKELGHRADQRRKENAKSTIAEMSSWLAPTRHGLQGGFSITYKF